MDLGRPQTLHLFHERDVSITVTPEAYELSRPTTAVGKVSTTVETLSISGSGQEPLRTGIQTRPVSLPTLTHELLFVLVCSSAQLWTNINVGNVTVTLLHIQKSFNLDERQLPWLSGAFSLANGSLVIIFGSLADQIGPKKVFLGGCFWLALWSIIAAVSKTSQEFLVARAMHGAAAGALIPSGIALLGWIYEPGQRKNRAFSAFGAMAPLGFILGALQGGVVTSITTWPCMFWFNAILLVPFSAVAYHIIPPDQHKPSFHSLSKFDWLGSALAVTGLALIIFGFTNGPVASWAPYTYSLLILGIILLMVFVFVERSYATNPLMPIEIWKTKSFPILMLSSVLGWGGFAGWQFYVSLFYLRVEKASSLLTAAYLSPNGIIGVLATFICAATLHVVPGHYLFATSCLAFGLGAVFYIPLSYNPSLSYWYTGFLGIIFSTFGPDLAFASASIFVTSNVKRKYQGAAGSLVNTTIQISMSLGVGLAGVVESSFLTSKHVENPTTEQTLQSYRAAWFFSLGITILGTVLTILFVRIPKTDEKSHAE